MHSKGRRTGDQSNSIKKQERTGRPQHMEGILSCAVLPPRSSPPRHCPGLEPDLHVSTPYALASRPYALASKPDALPSSVALATSQPLLKRGSRRALTLSCKEMRAIRCSDGIVIGKITQGTENMVGGGVGRRGRREGERERGREGGRDGNGEAGREIARPRGKQGMSGLIGI